MPPKITIGLVTFNEESRVEHALQSARECPWCDEILVFDSGSTDGTVALAEKWADRVEYHPWVNFRENKKLLASAAKNDWVLMLDADEEISGELRDEIAELGDEKFQRHALFTMPRKNYILGRHARALDPDRVDRLFHRERVEWRDDPTHDARLPKQGNCGRLRGPILHNSRDFAWESYFDGQLAAVRIDTVGRDEWQEGKRCGFWELSLRPLAAFLKFYFLKGGYRDGTFGLLMAQRAAVSVQLKYGRLWDLQHRPSRAA